MTSQEELDIALDVSQCVEQDADAYLAALKQSRKEKGVRKRLADSFVVSVCTSDDEEEEERKRARPDSCVPPRAS